MPLSPDDIHRLRANVPGLVSVDGDEIVVRDTDGPPALLVDVIRRQLPDYAYVTGWEQILDRHFVGLRVRLRTEQRRPSDPFQPYTRVVSSGFGYPETDEELRGRIRHFIAWSRATVGESYPPDPTELETATDEHLTALASLYGIERRAGSIPTVNVMAPGSISKTEIKVSLKPSPEYASRYDRAEVV